MQKQNEIKVPGRTITGYRFDVSQSYAYWLRRSNSNVLFAIALVGLTVAIVLDTNERKIEGEGFDDETRRELEAVRTKAYKEPGMKDQIEHGLRYLKEVAGEVCGRGTLLIGAFSNAIFAAIAPERLTDATQRTVWDPAKLFASAKELVEMLNAFGQAKITTIVAGQPVTILGAQVIYDAVKDAGNAESKMIAAVAQLAATGSLTEENLRQVVQALPVEGSTFSALDAETRQALAKNAPLFAPSYTNGAEAVQA